MFIVMNEKRLAVIELIGPKIGDGPLWPTNRGPLSFLFQAQSVSESETLRRFDSWSAKKVVLTH